MRHMHTNTADSAVSSPEIHFTVLHSENVALTVAEPDIGCMSTCTEHEMCAATKLFQMKVNSVKLSKQSFCIGFEHCWR